MPADEITIEQAAQAVPCDEATLLRWLQQGHITGRDGFGRRNEKITGQSTDVVISIRSLKAHCAKIGITPNFGQR